MPSSFEHFHKSFYQNYMDCVAVYESDGMSDLFITLVANPA